MTTSGNGNEILPSLSGWEYEAAYWIDPSIWVTTTLPDALECVQERIENWSTWGLAFQNEYNTADDFDFSIHPEAEC